MTTPYGTSTWGSATTYGVSTSATTSWVFNTRPTRRYRRGVGFPSLSRAVALRTPTGRDPNNYYATLGVPADADERTIKRRCRALLRRFHPDGSNPDREQFERVEMIYRTLTDPVTKAQYDHTPEGAKWVDTDVVAALSCKVPNTNALRALLVEQRQGWSYMYEGEEPSDDVVDEWYRLLARVAAELGMTGVLRIIFGRSPHTYPGWVRVDPAVLPSTRTAIQILGMFKPEESVGIGV